MGGDKVAAAHLFPYDWTLKDSIFTRDKGTVFSTFSCGGGSSMGYELAGFDVIGNLEIDKRKNEAYVRNLHPVYNFCEDIREFRRREDLPEELFTLDILDGSPPCKSYSECGSRERTWGKTVKKYGITQVWDDLFFEFIALARRLRPRVVISENVRGILKGDAKAYVRRIVEGLEDAGYYTRYFLLDSSLMGVPQKRERVIFLGLRKDVAMEIGAVRTVGLFEENVDIDLEFHERTIPFSEIKTSKNDFPLSESKYRLWRMRKSGDKDLSKSCGRCGENPNKFFNWKYIYDHRVANTELAQESCIIFSEGRQRNKRETIRCATFPSDYDFCGNDMRELCGRAVPPVMMAQISLRVYNQWLSKI